MQYKNRRRSAALVMGGAFLFAPPLLGQQTGTAGAAAGTHAPEAPPNTSSQAPNAAPVPSLAEVAKKEQIDRLAANLSALEKGISEIQHDVAEMKEAKGADPTEILLPAFASLLGTFIGGFITFKSQDFLDRARRSAEEAALKARQKSEMRAQKVEQCARQLELYGPLRALLRQSNSIYRNMNSLLVESSAERFRMKEAEGAGRFDKQDFQIKIGEQWEPFRTILHIDHVYGKEYGVEPYFDLIVGIGEQIVKVINEKAAYARTGDAEPDLNMTFGDYLAHFAVLKELVATQKKNASSSHSESMPVLASAVFPGRIQGEIENGYLSITRELKECSIAAEQQA